MVGVLFSLLPLFGWGISDYVSSHMSRRLHPAATNLFFAVGAGIPITIFCAFFGWPEISVRILLEWTAVSVILTGGYIAMLKAFENGVTGIVAPIVNAYAVITLAVVVIFLGVDVSSLQVLSVLIVALGIYVLSYKKTKGKFKFNISILYALSALTLFGIGFAGYDVVAGQEWYQNAILFELVNMTVAVFVAFVWTGKDIWKKTRVILKFRIAYIGVVSAAIGSTGLFLALDNVENVAIPATITAASPLVTVGLARFYDNEKLSLRQYVAALIIVGGIILLGVSS